MKEELESKQGNLPEGESREETAEEIPEEESREKTAEEIPEGESREDHSEKNRGESGRRRRRRREDREFLRGTLFGILLTVCCYMLFILIRSGASGGTEDMGARVLTSAQLENKLRQVEGIIDDEYYYDVDAATLEDGLFKGVAYGLTDQDRYVNYYTAEELAEIQQENEGEYRGIGITISQDAESGTVTISKVTADGPADRAGILEGDILLKVDDTEVSGMELSDIADMIKGADSVELTISRDGEEKVFRLSPEQVKTAPVEYKMLDGTIGYMLIPEFDSVTTQQFKDALTSLMDSGMKSMVIDLRDNPGGLLDVVAEILDQLLPEGKIVTTETRKGEDSVIYSDEERMFEGDLAVLVNGQSASGAELFAGAIQDYGLGPVVGEQTFGKGIVQTTFSLSDGSAFKLTTDKYLTAGGQDIDGVGITPDIKVSSEDALDAALEALKNGWKSGEAAEEGTEESTEGAGEQLQESAQN